MFYSHTFLRRNGRFGLVWLAATRSKVLSKRELYAINVSRTCSDILNHIPGYMGKDVLERSERFSLYLSSQLMFGSVRVLQKQWEFLFVDVTGLLRRFHPEISSEIDLVLLKQDPVTLSSCVPTSKEYDPFFGIFKESTVDVDAYLDIWDTNYMSKFGLDSSEQPDIGSPSSTVSDPMQIQIRDNYVTSIDQIMPDEQDLPFMDMDNLALLGQAEDVVLSSQELCSSQISRILGVTDITFTHGGRHPPVEETPAVKTSENVPRTPQKPKRKRHLDVLDERRAKHRIFKHVEGLTGQGEETLGIEMTTPRQQQAGAQLPRHHDWLQQGLLIQLSPVTSTPSPARRRRPRRLIIDQKTQMSRDEMKENMLTSESTTQPLILPNTHQTDWLNKSGVRSLKHPTLSKLWTRNCKFGLRIYDTDTESSPAESVTSPVQLGTRRGRTRPHTDDTITSVDSIHSEAYQQRSISMSSIEHHRNVSGISTSLEGDQSRSLVAQAIDDSQTGLSAKKRRLSTDSDTLGREGMSQMGLEMTGDLGALTPWPEEQEPVISPIPLSPVPDPSKHPLSPVPDPSFQTVPDDAETPRTQVLRLVNKMLRTEDDWTTFRTICPPASSNRVQAARLFMALCCQVGQRNLCVRQDEHFGDIFIWLPADRSE